jgi:hypothetical protein
MSLALIPATAAHADLMAPLLRSADVAEIHIMFGPDPAEMLRHGIERSSHAYAALEDGVPFCIGGVVPVSLMGGEGVAWLLGTEGIARNRRWFLRQSRIHLAAVLQCYQSLSTTCDATYEKSIRWLGWLGFDAGQPFTFGPKSMSVLPFSMGR